MSHDNITELSDTLTVSFPLSDASPKDKPWDKHRANSDTVKGMYQEVGYGKYADRIQECSQRLIFALQEANDDGERLFHLTGARFCRVRHCPVCQWRRSLMWRARFFKVIPGLLGDYPKARFIFLTLTVRNCPLDELRETIGWMNKAWKRLTDRKQFPALGWVKSVEVTRGEDGSAHPHFHVVLMVKPSYFSHGYLSQADWTELWKKSLRVEYTPVVNVKAIKGKGDEKGIFIALCETLKYSVKEDDLKFDKRWLQGVTQQLHKTRAVSLGGIFKSYLSDDEPEDLIHTELGEEELPEEAPEFTFSWRETLKKYMSD